MKKENRTTQYASGHAMNINWLHQLGAAEFIFFLVKGLAWIVAAAWVVY